MIELVTLLKELNYTVSTCESLTGGKFVSEMISVSGASLVVKGGLVSYSNETKINVAGIDKEMIVKFGVISKEVARQMSVNASRILNTDVAISFTGNTGPSVMENKPCGLVFCCIVIREKIYDYELQLCGDRNSITTQVVDIMKQNCIRILKELKSS